MDWKRNRLRCCWVLKLIIIIIKEIIIMNGVGVELFGKKKKMGIRVDLVFLS